MQQLYPVIHDSWIFPDSKLATLRILLLWNKERDIFPNLNNLTQLILINGLILNV